MSSTGKLARVEAQLAGTRCRHGRRSRERLDPGVTARIRIGLSGWTYPHWRTVFYPAGLPQRRELEFASRAFEALEINGSFYSLQRPSSYLRWRDATPDGFVFAVKGSRFITHMKKLGGVDRRWRTFSRPACCRWGPNWVRFCGSCRRCWPTGKTG